MILDQISIFTFLRVNIQIETFQSFQFGYSLFFLEYVYSLSKYVYFINLYIWSYIYVFIKSLDLAIMYLYCQWCAFKYTQKYDACASAYKAFTSASSDTFDSATLTSQYQHLLLQVFSYMNIIRCCSLCFQVYFVEFCPFHHSQHLVADVSRQDICTYLVRLRSFLAHKL